MENINLEDHFLFKTLFSSVNFWTAVLLKTCPIFDKLTFINRFFLKISLEYVDFWPKILFFRTHHLWNSSTELMYIFNSRTSVWSNEIYTCTYQIINLFCHKNNPRHMTAIELQNVRTSELFLMLQFRSNFLLFLKKNMCATKY